MRFGPALQSTDPQTLANVKRSNISETALIDMASAAQDLDQRSYTELILGLPGDTLAVASPLHPRRHGSRAAAHQDVSAGAAARDGDGERRPPAAFGLRRRFRILPQSHGMHRFLGAPFPSVELTEFVIATHTMSFDDYLACKRFELSVEIFYNDGYLEEIHGLLRGLELPDVRLRRALPCAVRRLPGRAPGALRGARAWACATICGRRARPAWSTSAIPPISSSYAREEYTTSLGTLKAIALLEHIESILAIARVAFHECLVAAGWTGRRCGATSTSCSSTAACDGRSCSSSGRQPEGTFCFAFDRIMERRFRVDPHRLPLERTADDALLARRNAGATDPDPLRATANPALRARSFLYPATDPGTNPYLRRSRFC